MAESKDDQPFRIDRTALSIIPLEYQDDEGAYWATKTPEERMRALCNLRWLAYGSAAVAPMVKVLEIAEMQME